MKKIITIILVVIIVAAAVAATWLFMSGKLAWVDSNTKTVTVKAVCETDIVNKYNDVTFLVGRNNSSVLSVDEQGIKDVTAEITAKENYKTDPSCQAMLFWISYRNKDYETAKSAYDAVHSLHDQGRFADSNIRGDEPLFTYEEVLFTISPQANDKHEVMGG